MSLKALDPASIVRAGRVVLSNNVRRREWKWTVVNRSNGPGTLFYDDG